MSGGFANPSHFLAVASYPSMPSGIVLNGLTCSAPAYKPVKLQDNLLHLPGGEKCEKIAVHGSHTQNGPKIQKIGAYWKQRWCNGVSLLANVSIRQLANLPPASDAHFNRGLTLRVCFKFKFNSLNCCLYSFWVFFSVVTFSKCKTTRRNVGPHYPCPDECTIQ